MFRLHARPRLRAAAPTGVLLGMLLVLGGAPARADPPIRSAEDAACRLEAKARVFSAPNPRGLEPEAIGRQLYYACMSRYNQPVVRSRKRGRHHRRHHRHRRR